MNMKNAPAGAQVTPLVPPPPYALFNLGVRTRWVEAEAGILSRPVISGRTCRRPAMSSSMLPTISQLELLSEQGQLHEQVMQPKKRAPTKRQARANRAAGLRAGNYSMDAGASRWEQSTQGMQQGPDKDAFEEELTMAQIELKSQFLDEHGSKESPTANMDGPQESPTSSTDGPQESRTSDKDGPQESPTSSTDGPQESRISDKDGAQESPNTPQQRHLCKSSQFLQVLTNINNESDLSQCLQNHTPDSRDTKMIEQTSRTLSPECVMDLHGGLLH